MNIVMQNKFRILWFFFILSVSPFFVAITTVSSEDTSNTSMESLQVLEKILKGYDRRASPTTARGIPTNVTIELFFNSISIIDSWNMDYHADVYLTQRWSDPRLSHSDIKSHFTISDPPTVRKIWKPTVFFPTAKSASFQFVTVPNVLVKIYPNGEVLYMIRLGLKSSCMMEFSRYPLDNQVCKMKISSFGKSTNEILLNWEDGNYKEKQFQYQMVFNSLCLIWKKSH